MENIVFKSKHFPDYTISIGIANSPKCPFVAFETKDKDELGVGVGAGVVHFETRKEWEEFKRAIEQAERKAEFKKEDSVEAEDLRDIAKELIKMAETLEEDC